MYVIYNKEQRYSSPMNITRDLCYIYDNMAPKHCKDIGSCTHEPLALSKEVTREQNITAFFGGWEDQYPLGSSSAYASKIKSYELYLFEMIEGSLGTLKMDTTSLITAKKCMCTMEYISLPESTHPALYAVVLKVVDNALNVRQARRFVFRDDVSVIAIRPNNPFLASTATMATRYTWQTNHGQICLKWTDRFYNDKMVQFNPLNPIEAHPHGLFQGVYEQTNGAIPVNGTKNVHGITEFRYSVFKTGINVVFNQSILNFLSQRLCIPQSVLSTSDGETITVTLHMFDLVHHTMEENSTVYMDSSGPEISDIWLEKDGRHQIYVHDSTDLSEMQLVFKAFDSHSGLHSVQWFIGTSDDEGHFGHGALGVIRLNGGVSKVILSIVIHPLK